jgi:hypothetical protein
MAMAIQRQLTNKWELPNSLQAWSAQEATNTCVVKGVGCKKQRQPQPVIADDCNEFVYPCGPTMRQKKSVASLPLKCARRLFYVFTVPCARPTSHRNRSQLTTATRSNPNKGTNQFVLREDMANRTAASILPPKLHVELNRTRLYLQRQSLLSTLDAVDEIGRAFPRLPQHVDRRQD